MFEIEKTFGFSASHRLSGLAPGHQCGNLHGHNYTVTVTMAADALDETGFVLDTTIIGELKNAVDHKHLNDVMIGEDNKPLNPSAENLAKWLGQKLLDLIVRMGEADTLKLVWIKVRETDSTIATWYPGRSLGLSTSSPSP
jgi:6-pyruvoyltetrahydropterin/6-carboxytetrahydropterin synthase